MYAVLLTIFILVCLVLVIVVLLQSSKGGGLAGAFGGSSDVALLGGRSAGNLLTKLTGWLAGCFIVLALVLSILSAHLGGGEAEEGIVARQQRQGATNAVDVQAGASILDALEMPAAEEAEGAGSEETPAEDPAGEPVPVTP